MRRFPAESRYLSSDNDQLIEFTNKTRDEMPQRLVSAPKSLRMAMDRVLKLTLRTDPSMLCHISPILLNSDEALHFYYQGVLNRWSLFLLLLFPKTNQMKHSLHSQCLDHDSFYDTVTMKNIFLKIFISRDAAKFRLVAVLISSESVVG